MNLIEEIGGFINKKIATIPYPSQPAGLYEPIRYTLEGGGKRLRPTLLLLSCHSFCGDYQRAVNQALGIEMFHNFTLLHDDVMDKSEVRRGRATVHRQWNEATAILSGDAMLTLSCRLMVKNAGDKAIFINDLFHKMAMEIYEGQQYDMDFEVRDIVSLEEYIDMIRLKTSVLLGAACQIGAVMGGADITDAQILREMAINLGLAFQLQDDYLDTFGDPDTFGKRIGGDILNAKKTALLITAANRDPKVLKILGSDIADDKKISQVRQCYNTTGASEYCRNLVMDYSDKAHSALNRVHISDDAKTRFAKIIEMSAVRNV